MPCTRKPATEEMEAICHTFPRRVDSRLKAVQVVLKYTKRMIAKMTITQIPPSQVSCKNRLWEW